VKNRVLIAAMVIAGVLVWAWSFRNAFASQAARECIRLYTTAQTAADTAGIDALVPAGTYHTPEPRSCGSFRSSARWLAHP
jgi:hypothetical protein